MTREKMIAGVVLVGGAAYLLARRGVLDLSAAGVFPDSDVPYLGGPLTRQQAGQLAAREALTVGNAPLVSAPSFIGSPQGISGLAATGVAALPLFGVGGVALGITTAGIGVAAAFIAYEVMRQRSSMHVNDIRDAWQRQFIDVHDALGLMPLTYAQTAGSGPGNIEMAEVIFYFDHDENQTLWKSVTHTQDERAFRVAAMNVEAFLERHGIPVVSVA